MFFFFATGSFAAGSVTHETSSHMILRRPSSHLLIVSNHRELANGTLRALIRDDGLTKEQFVELL